MQALTGVVKQLNVVTVQMQKNANGYLLYRVSSASPGTRHKHIY